MQTEDACGGTMRGSSGIISSPNFPNEYHNNADCTWTIVAEPGDTISLIFTDFQMEEKYDYLEIEGSEPPTIGIQRLSGMNIPPPVISNKNWLRLHFVTDSNHRYRGFSAHYQDYDKKCMVDHYVGITQLKQNYKDARLKKKWLTYAVHTGLRKLMKIMFSNADFQVNEGGIKQASNLCPDPGEPENGKRIGSDFRANNYFLFFTLISPFLYDSNAQCVWVITAINTNKIVLLFVCQVDAIMFLRDSLSSQKQLSNETYKIIGDQTCEDKYFNYKVIQINFEEFDLEIGYDTLTIGDGGEVGDPKTVLQVLTGSFVPDLIVSMSNQMWLHLQTDESVGSIGFKVNYKVPCLSNFTAPMGTVLSPDYPEGYGNNLNCIWTIISDPGSRIHLSFNDFDLESQFDFLAVKDGNSVDSPIIGTFTGAEVPSHLTSNGHILRLEFQADHSMSGRGFNITYNTFGHNECPDPGVPINARRFGDNFQLGSSISVICEEGFIKTQGTETITCMLMDGKLATSPRLARLSGVMEWPLPGTVREPGSLDCIKVAGTMLYVVEMLEDLVEQFYPQYFFPVFCALEADLGVQFTFYTFHLEDHHDYLLITENGSFTQPLARLTGSELPSPINAGLYGNFRAQLRFISDFSISYEGFNISFSAECGASTTNNEGILLSPNYPLNYENNHECIYSIQVQAGKGINISARTFHLAQGDVLKKHEVKMLAKKIASHDILRVWDGPPENEMLLKEISGSLIPEGIHSTLNIVTIQFDTDFYISKSGFAIQFSSSVATACRDPGVPMNGTRNGDGREPGDTVIFQCDPGYELQGDERITCIQVENRIEPNYDFLYIYDGPDSNSPLIGSFQDSKLPERIESSSNTMHLAFRSDGSVSFTGFHLEYKVLCHGIKVFLLSTNPNVKRQFLRILDPYLNKEMNCCTL
ncbi:hypothetical protein IHE44_0001210 [Lamprotornis superbus]|uniref:CUB domain-containing protein n=1 Tax=Lamprotornis superbus TaxID=245042 RepID=A0A835TZS3_9PASS|nr:hypothetical protein IHE44_0001210 [Lamprotornis superbus]